MGNPIYTGPAFQVSFICFVENVKCIQSCQTCHLQGWDKIFTSWKLRGKILRCTLSLPGSSHSFFSLHKGNIVVSQEFTLQGGKCLLGYWKWMIFHPVNDLPSLQHLCFLSQNRLLLFPILCLLACTATNLLALTFPIFQTDGSFGMNYIWFHSQPNPSHSITTTDKRAHRFASYACKGLFYPCTDRGLNGQHRGLKKIF